SCGLVLCSCFFAVCFADESTRTKPRNHTNQESRKDTKVQLMSQVCYYRLDSFPDLSLAQFTWLKLGLNETGLVRKNSIAFGIGRTYCAKPRSSLSNLMTRALSS